MNNIGLYSTTVTYLASKEIEIGEKTQNKGIMPFQVIPGNLNSWNLHHIILRKIFTDNIGLHSTTATYLASKEIEIGEKTQNKGYYAIQGNPRSSRSVPMEARMRLPISD